MRTIKLPILTMIALTLSFQTAYGQLSISEQVNRCVEKSSHLTTLIESHESAQSAGANLSVSGLGTIGLGAVMFSSGAAFLITGPTVVGVGAVALVAGGGKLLLNPVKEGEIMYVARSLYEMEKDVALDSVDGNLSSITTEYIQLCKSSLDSTIDVANCDNVVGVIESKLQNGELCAQDYLALLTQALKKSESQD